MALVLAYSSAYHNSRLTRPKVTKAGIDAQQWVSHGMRIGTFARNNDQVAMAIDNDADFVELRMDLEHSIDFEAAKRQLSDAGIGITLHLPSWPDWRPIEVSQLVLPYVDLGRLMDAELVTIHTTLSSIFYTDGEIDDFLNGIGPVCEAAESSGVQLAIENLGLQYTELALLFDQQPCMKMVLDVGHAQIMALRNRALDHVEFFYDRIAMVNLHDNNGSKMLDEVIVLRREGPLSRQEMREVARRYDEHLPIGEGSVDFESVLSALKKRGYDGRFLMMCADPARFPEEREKFLALWQQV